MARIHDVFPGERVVRAVGGILFDGTGRLLLVQRGHAPARGRWTVPGGRVEPGETDAEAVRREMAEETGLDVVVGALAGTVRRAGGAGIVYEIFDYDVRLVPGGDPAAARAGDDAAALAWVAPAELDRYPLSDGLVATLRSWGRLP